MKGVGAGREMTLRMEHCGFRSGGDGVDLRLLAALGLIICRAAGAQVPTSDGAMLEETEATIAGQKMVFVKHRSESYQRIEIDDLKGQAEGQASLSGVLACVEGKFDRLVDPSAFALVGSNRCFDLAMRKPALLHRLLCS